MEKMLQNYTGTPVELPLTQAGWQQIRGDFSAMLFSLLDVMLNRNERNCASPFIDAEWGRQAIKSICANHIHDPAGQGQPGEPYDMWEFVDGKGCPYYEGKQLRTDPGHAIEFAGLSLKLLRLTEKLFFLTASDKMEIGRLRKLLVQVAQKSFQTGFLYGRGFVKGLDLISRQPINPQMPWWAITEAMRTAHEASLADQANRQTWTANLGRCYNAFVMHFVNRNCNLMAYQTLGADGKPSGSIPATPDADPGYHTGLCLIDCLTD